MPEPTILIVDDEPFNLSYLEQELEDTQAKLVTALNGQDALAKVLSETPDVILLDIMMPVMDGFEVLTRLKADPLTRDIPVIVISANNSMDSVVKGIQLGAEDYLPKPFDPVLLHARITSSLEKKRLRDIEKRYLDSLEREFDIAREIQQGFLPSELPVVEGWEIEAYFKAAKEVAGDFYDAFLLPDGNLVCVIGDVCGKGVGAALFMTLFRSLVRATATRDLSGLSKGNGSQGPEERLTNVVAFTNNYVAETHEEANMFTTLFMGILEPENGRMVYINGGNEPAYALTGNAPIPLAPTGPVVGVIADAVFQIGEIKLNKGDSVFIYTDGIPDALNTGHQPFGKDRLIKLLADKSNNRNSILHTIESEITQFIDSAEQFDDITILTLTRKS